MYPFNKLGVTPELGSSMMLPFLVGMAKSKEMFMLGEWLSAQDALQVNLVNAVVDAEELLPRALAAAAKIASFHPTTMGLMKKVINAPLREHLDAVLTREQEVIMASIKASGGFAKNAKL